VAHLDRDAPVYSIGVVETLTGLTARQIRYYEKAGLVAPYRTPGNQRLYSPNQVDRLLEIKTLLAQGYTLEGIKSRWKEPGAGRALEPGVKPAGSSPGRAAQAPPELVSSEEHLRFIQTLRAGQPLSSLYPVNNQAELIRRLQRSRWDDSG